MLAPVITNRLPFVHGGWLKKLVHKVVYNVWINMVE